MLGYVGGHDLGLSDRKLQKHYLQGANMSFRRKAFDDLGGFSAKAMRCDDGEFCRRLQKVDKSVYYVPDALVLHQQPQDRLQRKRLTGTSYLTGLSEAAVEQIYFGKLFVCLKSGKKLLDGATALVIIPWNILMGNWAEVYYLFLRSVFGAGYIRGVVTQLVTLRPLPSAEKNSVLGG